MGRNGGNGATQKGLLTKTAFMLSLNEFVADAALADDRPDRARIAFQLLAQAADVHLQVVYLVGIFAPPDLREKRLMGQYAARISGQVEQERILRRRQADR